MLWIALHLPHLPLEVFLRGTPAPEPFAVADPRGFILACDRKAAARGIAPGMAAPAALALSARLVVRERDPAAETEAVLGIATWASQFTPTAAITLPDTVLLEVEGSLQLFGGVGRILAALQSGLADMGFSSFIAGAPTPLAASWLALAISLPTFPATRETGPAPTGARLITPAQLDAALGALPLAVLRDAHGVTADDLDTLQGLGIAILAELLDLPRDGLARRFGQTLLDVLDRARGRLPDPRTPFRLPERFHAGIELPAEVTQSEALLFAARRLLVQLTGFLAARCGGVQRFTVTLLHRDAVTRIPVGLVTPSRDGAHFLLLLRERLAGHALREPVRALSVSADEVLPLAGESLGLFASDVAEPGSWEKLVERLRARLGAQSVHGVAIADEHRPERAGTLHPDASERQASLPFDAPAGARPFWLLEKPQPMREVDAIPHDGGYGPLELLAGPERIETGWWDGHDVARDYFVARSPANALLWVYRERKVLASGSGWYLHGIFA